MMQRFLYIPAPVSGYANAKSLNLGNSNSTKRISLGATAFNVNHLTAISFSIWVKLGTGSIYQPFFNNQKTSDSTGYNFGLNPSNQLWVQFYNGANSHQLVVHSTETVTTGVWHHYGLSLSGSGFAAGVVMTIDGVAVTKNTDANNVDGLTASGTACYIGASPVGDSWLQGRFDEAAIYNGTALSAADFAAIYNAGVPKDISATTGLTSYYRCEPTLSPADDATTLYDRKGSNNGTCSNIVSGDYSSDVP